MKNKIFSSRMWLDDDLYIKKLEQELERYKDRIDKAIEYINKSIDNHTDWYNYIHGDEDGEVYNLDILLNILQGSDK